MANIKSIEGNPIVLGLDGLTDEAKATLGSAPVATGALIGSNGSVTVPNTSTSGLMHTSTANDRFGHSLSLNGKSLSLISYDGTVLSTVTLP